jgi:nanoRNase/pAp phosphatase (c-di-AMP/oligoRNAs hydrolase)
MAHSSADPPHGMNGVAQAADRLLASLAEHDRVTLISHVHPDPDSLGSMMGLAHLIGKTLKLPVALTRDGFIGRAENRAMVDVLGIDLTPIDEIDLHDAGAIIMVDSQPNTGRHSLPPDVCIHGVIDHHEITGEVSGLPFKDIRTGLGATCTLIASYLIELELKLPPKVATALFYGIESEVTGYPREASKLDDSALLYLYPHVQKDLLAAIRNARLPHSYFETLVQALQNSFIYDKLIISWADELPQPDLTAEIADFLLRFEEVEWALCAGVYRDQLVISARTIHPNGKAGIILQQVVNGLGRAGGHDRRAGGSIPLDSTSDSALEQLRSQLRRRLLEVLDIDERRGQRLVSRKELLENLQV